MIKKILFLLFVSFLRFTATAQEPLINPDTLQARIIGSVENLEQPIVKLRWMPTNFYSFQHLKKEGFQVFRYTLIQEGQKFDEDQILASKIDLGVFHTQKEELSSFSQEYKYAKVFFEALFNDQFEVKTYSENDLVRIYQQKNEKNDRIDYAMMSADFDFEVAVAAKVGFKDGQGIQRYSKYKYEIVPIVAESKNTNELWLLKDVVVLDVEEELTKKLYAPESLSAKSGDKEVGLRWTHQEPSQVAYFVVERSTDGKEWYPSSTSLIMPNEVVEGSKSYAHTSKLYENNISYQFRVYGKDIFDKQTPYSNIVIEKGSPLPIEANPDITKLIPTYTNLSFTWEFPSNYLNQITKYQIVGSVQLDGEYTIIKDNISKTAQTYTLSSPAPYMYYKLIAIDINGFARESVPVLGQLKDETPPAKPATPLCVAKGDNGDLIISWNPNTEIDLMGYRLFASDNQVGPFIQFTPTWIEQNNYEYKVNVNTLTKYAYFKVAAVDLRENLSIQSEACIFKIPDVIPPVEPNIVKTNATSKGNIIYWENSPSEDVIKHNLERRLYGAGTKWEVIGTFKSVAATTNNTYLDSLTAYNETYLYRVVAIDDSGLTGISQIVKLVAVGSGFRPNPIELEGCYIPRGVIGTQLASITIDAAVLSNPGVVLNWEYSFLPKLEDFVIYRTNDPNFAPVTIASIGAKESAKMVDDVKLLLGKAQCLVLGPKPNIPATDNINVGTIPNTVKSNILYFGTNSKVNDFFFIDTQLITPFKLTNELFYWVQARYSDGTVSELVGPVAVKIQ
jgi:uncharacterized protein